MSSTGTANSRRRSSVDRLAAVESALEGAGLAPRGAFHPVADDGVPALGDGRAAGTLVLAGNVGGAMWQAFSRARRAEDEPNPLDAWARRVLTALSRPTSAAMRCSPSAARRTILSSAGRNARSPCIALRSAR